MAGGSAAELDGAGERADWFSGSKSAEGEFRPWATAGKRIMDFANGEPDGIAIHDEPSRQAEKARGDSMNRPKRWMSPFPSEKVDVTFSG